MRYSFSDSVEINDSVNLLLRSKDYYRLKRYKKIREDFEVYDIRYKGETYVDVAKYNSKVRSDETVN